MDLSRLNLNIKISLLTLAVVIGAPLAVSAQVITPGISEFNLIPGIGEMEANWQTNGIAEGWELWWWTEDGPVQPSLDPINPYSGTHSQRFDVFRAGTGPGTGIQINTSLKVGYPDGYLQPGETWTISFYMRTSPVLAGVLLHVFYQAGVGNQVVSGGEFMARRTLLPTPMWTRYTYTFTVPSGVQWVRPSFNVRADAGPAVGTVWIDNVQITNGQPFPSVVQKSIKTYCLYPYNTQHDWLFATLHYDGGRWEDRDYTQIYDTVRPDALNSKFTRIGYTPFVTTKSTPFDILPYSWIAEHHPEWFLKDVNGNFIQNHLYVALDISNRQLQDELIRRYVDFVKRGKYRSVMWDAFDVHPDHNFSGKMPAKYAAATYEQSVAKWQQDLGVFFERVAGALRAPDVGATVIVNLAHCPTYEEPLKSWLQNYIDGVLIELGFVVKMEDGVWPTSYSSWRHKFLSLALAHPERHIILKSDGGLDTKLRRFGLGSFLASKQKNSYFTLCDWNDKILWHEDLEAPIGAPLSTFSIETGNLDNGGLFKRVFSNGLVLVNAHETQSYNYNLPATYRDLDGTSFGPGMVNIAPQTSLILLGQNPADNAGPNVAITAPAKNARVNGTVNVTTSINDPSGVSIASLYVNGTQVATDRDAPFTFSWNTATLTNGNYNLVVKATDGYGNTRDSETVTVDVFNEFVPPTVNITSPTNNATVTGPVTISAHATDNIGIARVEFLVDGNVIGTDTTAPYSVNWESRWMQAGRRTLVARAVDTSNNVATSAAVQVNSGNVRQSGTITLPGNNNLRGQQMNISWRRAGTQQLVWGSVTTVQEGGAYSLWMTPGTYDILVRLPNSLRAIARNVNLNQDAVVNFTVVGGDANADNVVDDGDLTALILDFGGPQSGPQGAGRTDFNSDGIVDDADLMMLILAFGERGAN